MILQQTIDSYLESLRRPPDDLLEEMEEYAAEHGVPIAPPETAALVAMLARSAGARLVLEIGLAIGYTALHIA
ncbi:MAG TPA: O-methyltransferase, partial [Thermoleophilia bacterium]|nr:O-methyltransferase [Thermoleophilia bacterium]